MKKVSTLQLKLTIALALLVFTLFAGCKKENACNDVVQDDFELVE